MIAEDPVVSTQVTAMQEGGYGETSGKAAPEEEHAVTPQLQQQGMSSPPPWQQQQQQQRQLAAYPPALATHNSVVADRDLFYDTLNKFHASLGTRLSIPTIGGKELDLHLLYVEVSTRGGLEQVIRERKWKEVTIVFNFPPTTTSASFVLRKYYVSLLHHYEQVYFFGTQGSLVSPPISASLPNQSPSPAHQPVANGLVSNGGAENGELIIKKRKKRTQDHTQLLEEAEFVVPIGHGVSGVIDGKFERGYLVTVTVGTEKLKGILYHLPVGSVPPQFATVSEMAKGIFVESAPEHCIKRKRRRKDEMPKKDPNAPKPNRSGYNFFFQEQRRLLKELHPDKDKEISKMIGELWNKQTEEERAIYQERGIQDKERYKKEMELYRGGLKLPTAGGDDGDGDGDGEEDGDGDGDGDGGVCGIMDEDVVHGMDAAGRPDQSMSSLSETDSAPVMEEEKLKSDVGTS